MLRVLHVSCLLQSPLLPFVKFFDNTIGEREVDSEFDFFFSFCYEMCSQNRIGTVLLLFFRAWM